MLLGVKPNWYFWGSKQKKSFGAETKKSFGTIILGAKSDRPKRKKFWNRYYFWGAKSGMTKKKKVLESLLFLGGRNLA
jgi:hypothetical protein